MHRKLADLRHRMEQAVESGDDQALVWLAKKYLATWREALPSSRR